MIAPSATTTPVLRSITDFLILVIISCFTHSLQFDLCARIVAAFTG